MEPSRGLSSASSPSRGHTRFLRLLIESGKIEGIITITGLQDLDIKAFLKE